MADQELRQRITTEGAEDAAAKLDKVDAAQGKLADGAEKQDQAQQKSSASAETYVALLSRIDPRLGALADSLFKATRVTDGMSDSTFNLGRAFKDLAGFLNTDVSALTAFSTAGVVAFAAVAVAVKGILDDFKAVTAAIQEQIKAMNDLQQAALDAQQAIENQRESVGREPFTAEESQRALERFQRIRERFPFISEEAAQQAVAAGGGFDLEQTARAARLIETGKLKPEAQPPQITAALARFAGELDAVFQREARQREELLAGAGREASQIGGSTLGLRERLARRARPGQNIDFLVQLAQSLGGVDQEALNEAQRRLTMAETGESPSLHALRRLIQLGGLAGVDARSLSPTLGATQSDFAVLRGTFQEILAEQRKQTAAMERAEHHPRVQNFHNTRVILPGTKSRAVNGQSRLEQLGHRIAD